MWRVRGGGGARGGDAADGANREVTAAVGYKLQTMTVEITAQASITLTLDESFVKDRPERGDGVRALGEVELRRVREPGAADRWRDRTSCLA